MPSGWGEIFVLGKANRVRLGKIDKLPMVIEQAKAVSNVFIIISSSLSPAFLQQY